MKLSSSHRISKQAFTLFELLLVMTIVAIAFATLAIQIPKALKREGFESGVERVISRINLAQETMLDYHTNVTLTLISTETGLETHLETDQPIPERVEKAMNRKKTIEGIYLDKTYEPLLFDASVGSTPKMTLCLKGRHNQEATLNLRGFPSKIRRGKSTEDENEATYPEEILSLI